MDCSPGIRDQRIDSPVEHIVDADQREVELAAEAVNQARGFVIAIFQTLHCERIA